MRLILSVIGAGILLAFVLIIIYLGEVILPNLVTGLAVLLVGTAFALLSWGVKPHFDKSVSLKIKNPRVETHNLGTKDEVKNLLFDIKNNGKIEAKGCKAKIKVVGEWDEFEPLARKFPDTTPTFNVLPKDKWTICLCDVRKKLPTTTVIYIADIGNRRALTKGVYKLELFIVGENFANGKIHKLKLDISSWENFELKLNC